MGIRITLNSFRSILEKRGLDAGGSVQRVIDSAVLRYSEPFVPKRSGALIASGYSGTKIGSGKIVYTKPYAAYQYYGRSRSGKALRYGGGSRRGSYWFVRMKAVYANTILAEAAAAAGAKKTAAKSSKKDVYIPPYQNVKTVLGLRRSPILR